MPAALFLYDLFVNCPNCMYFMYNRREIFRRPVSGADFLSIYYIYGVYVWVL